MNFAVTPLDLAGTQLFSAWHLNLNYSALDRETHSEVIEKCYWPLLHLAETSNCAQGIELSGSTLQRICEIDCSWVEKLISLEKRGLVEVLSSGQHQIVGPLAPSSVNAANFRLGSSALKAILGTSPRVAFVNEQCVSKGILLLLEDLGFEAAIVEWENAWIANPGWSESSGWRPQRFLSPDGLRIIWNRSRWFQGLQRYAHEELNLSSLINIYREAEVAKSGAFCFYGGDAETFDFRAGRFSTEANRALDEWGRIRDVVEMTVEAGAKWVKPSEIETLELEEVLDLFDIENQVLTKKQPKYNAVRWAVSGRANYDLNNYAHTLARREDYLSDPDDNDLDEEVLSMWASDLRTHLTHKRWTALLARNPEISEFSANYVRPHYREEDFQSHSLGPGLVPLGNRNLSLDVNLRKGLTVETGMPRCSCSRRLIGRVPYGTLPASVQSPDWYSGNFVHSPSGGSQDSDISMEVSEYEVSRSGRSLRAEIETRNFTVRKTLEVSPNTSSYWTTFELIWRAEFSGSLRVGFMSLNPSGWDWNQAYFESHDGGFQKNRYYIKASSFDHGNPVSSLVSASNLAGTSEGEFSISDGSHRVTVELGDSSRGAALMLALTTTPSSSLLRTYFSLQEIDDTYQRHSGSRISFSYKTTLECL
jgi:hypothetical protein